MESASDENVNIIKVLHGMENWFEANPNLPDKIQPIVLLRFLKCMEFDVEKTKALIELNYRLRNKNPNLFIDRNMDDESTAKGLKASDVLILPGLTPERNKLLLFRMVDYDPKSRNSTEESKIFFMMSDTRFCQPDIKMEPLDEIDIDTYDFTLDDIAEGDVQIVDIAGYTMRHLAYLSIFVLRIHMKFVQEAYPSRLRAMHIINCPSFLDRMMTMMKPFIREDVFQIVNHLISDSTTSLYTLELLRFIFQMNYHTEGLESLYKLVPRDMLPEEYGGKAGTIAEIKEQWLSNLRDNTKYLSDESYWKIKSQNRSRWSWF